MLMFTLKMMRNLRLKIGCVILACSISGCSNVTTYGLSPENLGEGRYTFTLSYNAYATEEEIDNKAKEITENIRRKNQHDSCAYSRGDLVSPWQVKQIKVAVNCE